MTVSSVKSSRLAVVILAAGKGTRMQSDLPKVLHPVAGKPIICHVLDTAQALEPEQIVVVVGHGRELVREAIRDRPVQTVVQDPPRGTGHAVLMTEQALTTESDQVLILSGDVPLLRSSTLGTLIERHLQASVEVTVLSTMAPDPRGYGRIVRERGTFVRIVEEKDATDELRKINEINSGIYVVRRESLFRALHQVVPNNAKAEYYLTDIIGILQAEGRAIQALAGGEFAELQGINTPDELARAEQGYFTRSAAENG